MTLSVLYAGDSTFTPIVNVSYGPGVPTGATQVGTEVSLTGLLSNVTEIQFTFTYPPSAAGDYTGYREIDVFGSQRLSSHLPTP